jgi:SPP1 gp7 family putative phage head morphogenesis protein
VAVSKATLRHARTIRVVIDDHVEAALRDLVEAWGLAWDTVVDEWKAAAADLAATVPAGGWHTRASVLRNVRAQNALQLTMQALDELAQHAGVRILRDMPMILDSQEDLLLKLIGSELPDGVEIGWSRVSAGQLDAIVKRAACQIESSLKPLPRDVAAQMKQELIRGVITGSNPNKVASLLVNRLGARFTGGLWRARNIARTEMLDASRAAALQSRQANSDVLAGWRWMCSLASRTCPACLSMNGQLFPIDEPGPDDHPSGRCTAVPVTKSWRDLGIDLDEPAPVFPDAKAWFGQQSTKTQTDIMGAARLDAYNKGRIGWDQLAVQRDNPGWRRSYVTAKAA